jgi:hypothetical protein
MVSIIDILARFVLSVVVSAIIIYVASKLFGQKEGLGRAVLSAVIGAAIYGAAYFFIGEHIIASVIGGVVWLLALKGLYDIGWARALMIAVVVWALATAVGYFLPTLTGPL